MHQLETYLMVAAALFVLGLYAVVTRRNSVAILMGIELILNAANINFIAFSRFNGLGLSGHIFSIFVIVLAAAEAAVALAIIINIYGHFQSINADEVAQLKQ